MHQVSYGTTDIFFELKRTARKTMAIEVHPDSSILAVAPEKATIEEIKKRILKRSRWILKQQRYFEQFLPRTPKREYVSGETHYYLGRGYVLRVQPGNQNEVKLKGGQLVVTCKNGTSPKTAKNLLASWYYTHAERRFERTLEEAMPLFKSYNIPKPDLEIKRMSKRWGSCNTTDKITINPEIIKAPSKCIEYLIIHEMCHFIEPNHNKRFFKLLSEIMPNWEKWKDRLEQKLS